MPTPSKRRLVRSVASKVFGAISAIAMFSASIFFLVKGRTDAASYPAAIAGIIGYLILRPGKRQVRIDMGGVVVDVISDDTGAFQTGVDAVVTHVSNKEISERTLRLANRLPPPIPGEK